VNEQVVNVLFLKTLEKAKQDIPTRTKDIVLFKFCWGSVSKFWSYFCSNISDLLPKRNAAFINRRLATAANN
jgi:hypothetical protein